MERDYHFDNYKAFLILLVVIGHFIYPLQEAVSWTQYLRKAIFLFHMPAFVFISGYFAKHNDWEKLVKKFLGPYVIMQLAVFFIRFLTPLKDSRFTLVQPYFTLWFLPCLFFWRLLIEPLSRVKGIIPFSFLVGILAGFDPKIEEIFSLSRMICFFPFFLMGYRFNKEAFQRYAKRGEVKVASLVGIILIFVVLVGFAPYIDMENFLFRGSYTPEHPFTGAIMRCGLYAGGLVLTYLFMVLLPLKKCPLSWLGKKTMSVYLFHGILERIFEESPLVPYFESTEGAVIVILFSVLLTFILAGKPFSSLAEKMASLPIEGLVKKL